MLSRPPPRICPPPHPRAGQEPKARQAALPPACFSPQHQEGGRLSFFPGARPDSVSLCPHPLPLVLWGLCPPNVGRRGQAGVGVGGSRGRGGEAPESGLCPAPTEQPASTPVPGLGRPSGRLPTAPACPMLPWALNPSPIPPVPHPLVPQCCSAQARLGVGGSVSPKQTSLLARHHLFPSDARLQGRRRPPGGSSTAGPCSRPAGDHRPSEPTPPKSGDTMLYWALGI